MPDLDAQAEHSSNPQAADRGPWRLRLVCCERDDGTVAFATRDEAEAFREAYTSGPGVDHRGYSATAPFEGHVRAAILTHQDDDAPPAPATPTGTVDLMANLRASLDRAKAARAGDGHA
jgi:hypothetical protein